MSTRTAVRESPVSSAALYQREYRARRGTRDSVRFPPDKPRAVIQKWMRLGLSAQGVGYAFGVDDEVMQRVLASDAPLLESTYVRFFQRPNVRGTSRLWAWPAQRRVRALQRLGWSCRAIAECGGVSEFSVRDLSQKRHERVELRVHVAIVRAYSVLLLREPPRDKWALQVRCRALAKGWKSPLDWDDIDDPDEPEVQP